MTRIIHALPLTPPPERRAHFWLIAALVSLLAGFFTGDGLMPPMLFVLFCIWRLTPKPDASPILALALTYEWMQACIGEIYRALTGRAVLSMRAFDDHTIILVVLAALLVLAIGLRLGFEFSQRHAKPAMAVLSPSLPWPLLRNAFLFFLLFNPLLLRYANLLGPLRMAGLTLLNLHYVALIMVVRRLMRSNRWGSIAALLGLEVLAGSLGGFGNFREPEIFALLVLLIEFDRRKMAHWIVIGLMALVGTISSVYWTAIKGDLRAELATHPMTSTEEVHEIVRLLDRVGNRALLPSLDKTVDRLWQVEFPALAMKRIPALLPFEHGHILWQAVSFSFVPRWIDPNKGIIANDSWEVDKYAGVQVSDQGTSIAFGYMGESYVDFGLPWMMAPILMLGLLLGYYQGWMVRRIQFRELGSAATAVVLWFALYQLEQSWAQRLGTTGNLVIFLTLAIVLINRWLRRRHRARLRAWVEWRTGRTPTPVPLMAEILPAGVSRLLLGREAAR